MVIDIHCGQAIATLTCWVVTTVSYIQTGIVCMQDIYLSYTLFVWLTGSHAAGIIRQ